MPSVRRLSLRRFVASIVMVVLGLFAAETIIADSCDGDSSSGVLSVSDGARDAVPDDNPTAPGKAPAHSVHVCHCAHGHAGSLGVVAASPERQEHPGIVTGESVRTPPSVSPEPRFRPPLA